MMHRQVKIVCRHALFAVIVHALASHTALSQVNFPEIPDEVSIHEMPVRNRLEPIPPQPLYDAPSAWAFLPGSLLDSNMTRSTLNLEAPPLPKGRRSRDLVPLDEADQADVFYIHPTMLLEGPDWNADINDSWMNVQVEKWPLRHQASAFSGVGRVFAPRYRQAHIRIFELGDSLSWAAAAVAYSDVKRAFQHYLEHWNQGRPIVLAGHSQGSFHGRTLLQDFFEGTKLQDQLVAAYFPGMDMYPDDFEAIKACDSPHETGCLCTWMTYGKGYLPPWIMEKIDARQEESLICIHPVTWTTKLESHGRDGHLGVVRPTFRLSRTRAISAEIQPEGVLWIHAPHVLGGRMLQRENWHSGDINLFWANIYENAQLRTMQWHKDRP